jgi:hypothetical protein
MKLRYLPAVFGATVASMAGRRAARSARLTSI